jgi:hypothetical protein
VVGWRSLVPAPTIHRLVAVGIFVRRGRRCRRRPPPRRRAQASSTRRSSTR